MHILNYTWKVHDATQNSLSFNLLKHVKSVFKQHRGFFSLSINRLTLLTVEFMFSLVLQNVLSARFDDCMIYCKMGVRNIRFDCIGIFDSIVNKLQ
jgi:hypothetical protein